MLNYLIGIHRRHAARPLLAAMLAGVLVSPLSLALSLSVALTFHLSGGVAHGLSTLLSGLVFAYVYVLSRQHGKMAGFLASNTAHAVHNFVVVFIVSPLFPDERLGLRTL